MPYVYVYEEDQNSTKELRVLGLLSEKGFPSGNTAVGLWLQVHLHCSHPCSVVEFQGLWVPVSACFQGVFTLLLAKDCSLVGCLPAGSVLTMSLVYLLLSRSRKGPSSECAEWWLGRDLCILDTQNIVRKEAAGRRYTLAFDLTPGTSCSREVVARGLGRAWDVQVYECIACLILGFSVYLPCASAQANEWSLSIHTYIHIHIHLCVWQINKYICLFLSPFLRQDLTL